MQRIVLGGGCFWCIESVFLTLKGICTVTSGYMGGKACDANYQAVCTGTTGHIEVVQVDFDETIITLKTILTIFFHIHDPTSLDKQGNDSGSQYRSAIFYDDDTQKKIIDNVIYEFEQRLRLPIVTQVAPAQTFFIAEEYHQNFFNKNPTQSYCRFTIPPKLAKLNHYFQDYLKS